jgi:membrane associated rhomboid family serine protease
MFLHGGWLHLLGNMLFLWIFGNNIEDRLGPLRFVLFYLAGGVVATLAQVFFDTSSVIPLIGASGAIAAVMGAYLVWFPRAPILTLLFFFFIEIPAGIWLTIWFVMQFFTGPNSGVAYMAHVGGFVFGILVGAVVRRTDWWRRRPLPVYRPAV